MKEQFTEKNMLIMGFEGHEIRYWIDENQELWFVLKDVGLAISLVNHKNAKNRVSKSDMDGVLLKDPIGRVQETRIINEGGFYDLVLDSQKPAGKRLKRMVSHEILPSIRKTGQYSTTPQLPTDPEQQALLLATQLIEKDKQVKQLKQENLEKEAKILEDKEKVDFHNAITASNDNIELWMFGKELGIGPRKIFDFLEQKGILYKTQFKGVKRRVPKESYKKYIIAKETVHEDHLNFKVYVTPLGQPFLRNVLRVGDNAQVPKAIEDGVNKKWMEY